MSTLSIIIPSANDQVEAVETVKSIRATAGTAPEIIVVDDQSNPPVVIPPELNARVHRDANRLGAGGSKHKGAELATGEYLLFLDSHMRCEPGWYEKAMARIVGRPRTIHNGACVQLGYGTMEMIFKPEQRLFGSLENERPCIFGNKLGFKDGPGVFAVTKKVNNKDVKEPSPCPDDTMVTIPCTPVYCMSRFNFLDPDQNAVYSGHWAGECPDDAEVSCIMGACYFVPRAFFMEIGGWKSLRAWGDEEPFLALKAWLAGGECRMLKTVRIGHKFRSAVPWSNPYHDIVYNKIRAVLETCDGESEFLLSKMLHDGHFTEAMKSITNDMPEIEAERDRLRGLFVRDIDWFCDKFRITKPRDAKLSPLKLRQEYDKVCSDKASDIAEHLEYLSRLSSLCNHVTEMGVRYGNSTAALLYGAPGRLVSYDVVPFGNAARCKEMAEGVGCTFEFKMGSSLDVDIEPTDMLFIDTKHTFDVLTKELDRHHGKVRKYIAMHDTARTTYGDTGDDGKTPGLWKAISNFVRAHPEWTLFSYHGHNNGLTVLERIASVGSFFPPR